jgi:hypothetical protein
MKATVNYISENTDFICLLTDKVNNEVNNFLGKIKDKKTNSPLAVNVEDIKCQKYSLKEIQLTANIFFVFDAFTEKVFVREITGLSLDNEKEKNLIIKNILDFLIEREEVEKKERGEKEERERIKKEKEKKEREKRDFEIENILTDYIYKENKEYLIGLKENGFEWKDLTKESFVNKMVEGCNLVVNTELRTIEHTPSKSELEELIAVKKELSKINGIELLKIYFSKDDENNIFVEANILVKVLDYRTYVCKY